MEIILREITHQNWITFLIIGCFVLLAAIRFSYGQRFIDFINVLGADRFLNTRSKGIFIFHPFQLVLLLVQFIGISLIIYLTYCATFNLPFFNSFELFGVILLAYAAFEILKLSLERLSGYLLNFNKKMQPFIYKRLNVKNLLGILSLICSAIITYRFEISYYFIYSAITIIIAVYVISQFLLLSKYKDDFIRFPFYFILYFCTLEIGPYFILYKYLT